MPVYRLVGSTWEKKQNIFVALDPSKSISTQISKIAAKLSLDEAASAACRFFACDDATAQPLREIDPQNKSLSENGVAEKGSVYVMTQGSEVPSSVTETLGGGGVASSTPAAAAAAAADSPAATSAATTEADDKAKADADAAAAAAVAAQQKKKEEEEAAAAQQKKKEEEEAVAAAQKRLKEQQQQQQEQQDEEDNKKKADEEQQAAAAAAALKKKQEQEQEQIEAERQKRDRELQQQQEEDAIRSHQNKERQEREEKRKEDELVAAKAAAARKKEEEATFKKDLDRREMQKRKNEAEELERKRIMAEAASERKRKEEAARLKLAKEMETSAQPTRTPVPISRVSYSHRSLTTEMLFLQEEVDRQKLMNAASRELYNSLTATSLMSRSWHVSEKTPMLESMRLYAKTLTQRINLVQGAIAVKTDREMESQVIEEEWHREYAEDLRKMYDDVCQEVINLRAVTSKSSWEAHQAITRRKNAEQSEFIAVEKLRMEAHQREFAEAKLEEAESRLKDVDTRNSQLVSVVERLGDNLFARNNNNNDSSSPNSKKKSSVSVLLSESSTAQTAPGATSVVHCVDDVPDHVLSTTIQIERRWFEKDDKIRELTSALSSEKYKAREAIERQREAEEQCDTAVKNNSQMQSSLKDAMSLAKSWESKYVEADRMQKAYLADINKQREQIAKLQQELRTSESKAEANQAAVIAMTIERDRATEQVERQKGELQTKKDEVEKKHALIVNLETRETSLREQVAPFEKRVRDLTSSLSQATDLTQRLQKELDKRDQSLQKLRNHLASVTGFVGSKNNSSNNNNNEEAEKPVYHKKPLGFLGLPSNTSSTPGSRRSTPARTAVNEQLNFAADESTNTEPKDQEELPKRTSFRRVVSTSPSANYKNRTGVSPSPRNSNRAVTPNGRTPMALIYQHQLDKAEGRVAAMVSRDQQVGDRAIHAAAGSKIAHTLERLQKDLTDTEIELSKEVKLRTKLQQQLEVARRGVDELTQINIELREHNQQSLEDAINFFAGAGGDAMRSAIQEVYAYKEIMLENEQLKNANIDEHKRVGTLEVRCQVLERHLEALAKGGSPGVEALPTNDYSKRRNLSPRVAAATRKFESNPATATKPTSSGDIFVTSPQKAAQIEQNKLRQMQVAFDEEDGDEEEAAFRDDPQLLALIRDARRRQRAELGLPSEEDEELEEQRRRQEAEEREKRERLVLHVDVISPQRHRSPLNVFSHSHAKGAADRLASTQRNNAVGEKSMQSQKAKMLREQNLELEAKIKKLDDWRSAILDTEALAFERGGLGMTSGKVYAATEANRIAHTPPRNLTPHNNNHNNNNASSSSHSHNTPGGVISRTGRDSAYW